LFPEMVTQHEAFDPFEYSSKPENNQKSLPPKLSLLTPELEQITQSITRVYDIDKLPYGRPELLRFILAHIRAESYEPPKIGKGQTELNDIHTQIDQAKSELQAIRKEIGDTDKPAISYYEILHARDKALSDLKREQDQSGILSGLFGGRSKAVTLDEEILPSDSHGEYVFSVVKRLAEASGTADPNKPLEFVLNNKVISSHPASQSEFSPYIDQLTWRGSKWRCVFAVEQSKNYFLFVRGGDGYDSVSNGQSFKIYPSTEHSHEDVPLLAPTDTHWDLEFELRQLLVLYKLCWNLLVFVDEDLGPRVAASLPGHWEPQADRFHPPINLVYENMRRASVDIEIIQRAIIQRTREMQEDARPLTRHGESLLIADKLAIKSLAPFLHLIPKEADADQTSINVITYYSENTHIRRLPYDRSVIMIGIAYANVSRYEDDLKAYDYLITNAEAELDMQIDRNKFWPSFEFLAIPHEVGHFIYQYGQIEPKSGQPVGFDDLSFDAHSNDLSLSHWAEEIFADAYGCFVAGPLTAMGMQGLLISSSVREMSLDDGEHPVPIFRPFIISEILRVMSTHEALEKRFIDEVITPAKEIYGLEDLLLSYWGQENPYRFEQTPDLLDKNWEGILR
ncbi:MAG: hypothetical protein AAF633_28275, partial [Chloroflexota bacterium]